MTDKKFDQDFTELAAPDNSSRLMISKLDWAIRKTYWITWDKFTWPSITSAAFTGDDLVFTKDDNTTVTLVGGKTSLKGDKGDTGATGAVWPKWDTGATWPQGIQWAKGDTGATGAKWDTWPAWPQGIQGIQWVAGNGIASVTTNKVGKTTTVTITEDDSTVTNFNIIDWEDGMWSGDMLKSVYDPNNKVADAFSMDNMVETATKKILTATERTNLGNQSWTNTGDETATTIKTKLGITTLSGSNTGDQTSIVGITGTIAQFNTALTDADFATGGGTATGTNTGDNATNSQYSGLATSKQDTLVSGTNIKTINGTSILWSGDITITGGGGAYNPVLAQVFM